MPHIRVERFRPGDHQKNGPQHHKPVQLVENQKPDRMPRKNRRQHLRRMGHLHRPGNCQKTEPNQNHRSEKAAHPRRAVALDQKQANENGNGDGDHVGIEYGGDNADPFHGAQNGNSRGDHAVSIQQASRKEPQGDNARPYVGFRSPFFARESGR